MLVDLIGMGGSSRPENFNPDIQTPQRALDYFLHYLEQWRLAVGPLKNFYLAGHNFGGFVAGHWALKCGREAKIKKLLLISPVGIRPAPTGENAL